MTSEQFVSQQDALDIVFQHRNRAYGAYQLRRAYPGYLGRAFAIGLAFIGLLVVLPLIAKAIAGAPTRNAEASAAYIATEIKIEIPAPKMPKLAAPQPPLQQKTQRYVAFIPKPDADLKNETQPPDHQNLLNTKALIGAVNIEGPTDGPPTDLPDLQPGVGVDDNIKPDDADRIHEGDIQKMPTFPGGDRELYRYLADQVVYPQVAKENRIQGSVPVQFVVGKDGSISDVVVLRDPSGGSLGKEALRVIKAMPRWLPGEANGHPVKVRYTIPIKFKLE